LSLYGESDYSTLDFDLVIQDGQPTYPHDPLEMGDYNMANYSGDGGSINTSTWVTDDYNTITITELDWIQKGDGAVTKLALRSSKDIDDIEPDDESAVTFWSADEVEVGERRPKLIVNYTEAEEDLFGTYDQRIKLTVDKDKIDTADLTWFPVTVFFTSTQGEEIFDEFDADGDYMKCAFTKADGSTQLYAEMELFDHSESKAIYHVSRDGWAISSSATTDFYYYYDNDASDNTTYIGAVNTTAGGNVWDGNYELVSHQVDATTSTVLDSTSNSNDGTKKGANEPVEAAGKVGQAQDFESSTTDYFTIPDSVNVETTGNYTWEFIIKPESFAAVLNALICKRKDPDSDNTSPYLIIIEDRSGEIANPPRLRWLMGDNDTGLGLDIFGDTTLETGTYYYITLTINGTTAVIYLNGAVDGGDTYSGTRVTNAADVHVGIYYTDSALFPYDGIMDEARYSHVARNAAWAKATYNSLWDTLLTYGAEETGIINAIFFGMNF